MWGFFNQMRSETCAQKIETQYECQRSNKTRHQSITSKRMQHRQEICSRTLFMFKLSNFSPCQISTFIVQKSLKTVKIWYFAYKCTHKTGIRWVFFFSNYCKIDRALSAPTCKISPLSLKKCGPQNRQNLNSELLV